MVLYGRLRKAKRAPFGLRSATSEPRQYSILITWKGRLKKGGFTGTVLKADLAIFKCF